MAATSERGSTSAVPSGGAKPQGFGTAMVSGAAAGVANTLTGHPFDTLKVWAQTRSSQAPHNASAPVSVSNDPRALFRSLRTLYRGIGPPLLSVPLMVSLQFGLWERCRAQVWYWRPETDQTTCAFLSGLASGWLLCHVTNPLTVVKVQQQTGGAAKGNMGQVVSQLWREQGPRGLFRGYVPHALQEGFGRACYMGAYDWSKKVCGIEDPQNATLSMRVLCGASAGMAGWVITYPCDVVRNNLMRGPSPGEAEFGGSLDCARRIVQSKGALGLYRGFGYTVLRAVPVAAATLTTYDYTCLALTEIV